MTNPITLEGKTLFITGASDGIGKDTAIACSKLGAKLIISGRDKEKVHSTYDLLCHNGHSCIASDLTDFTQLNDIVDKLPSIDGVVHCAGISEGGRLFKHITLESIRKIYSINVEAPFLLTSGLIAKNKINKLGSVIFLSSISPLIGTVGGSLYSSSKTALISASRCLALEVANKGIRVNCISPGLVETAMIKKMSRFTENQRIEYPFGFGHTEDVASTIIFFCPTVASKLLVIIYCYMVDSTSALIIRDIIRT